jgi:hypothetical protein
LLISNVDHALVLVAIVVAAELVAISFFRKRYLRGVAGRLLGAGLLWEARSGAAEHDTDGHDERTSALNT